MALLSFIPTSVWEILRAYIVMHPHAVGTRDVHRMPQTAELFLSEILANLQHCF